VLCGGTSKIPRLQKAIGGIFTSADLLSSLNPDEVLALGAVTQAALVEEKWAGTVRPELKGR
jgi:molecular chaperone DnaK (HSP70)